VILQGYFFTSKLSFDRRILVLALGPWLVWISDISAF